MNKTQKALKLAIEQMQHLIKIYIPSPEWSGTAIQEDCYETIKACKEALAQPAQEPVAWHHYKTFDLIYHDVWEELLEGKDEWYPLDYQENTNLRQVVKNHIEDLRKCIPVLNEYPQMKQTMVEVERAISELQEALYTHPAPSWQGLSDDEIEAVTGEDIRSMYSGTYDSYRAIEQALKEKNT